MQNIQREIDAFNASKKNQKRIKDCAGYAFISCPDFKHNGTKYNYAVGLGCGLPLSMKAAQDHLKHLALQKPLCVLLSDHGFHRAYLLERLGETFDSACSKNELTLKKIREEFPSAQFLSIEYGYETVEALKETVPLDRNFENELEHWNEEGLSREFLEDRYKERYAQLKAFMLFCQKKCLCAVFVHSVFIFKIVSIIRGGLPIPVLFLQPT